jgi:hypothetical protein
MPERGMYAPPREKGQVMFPILGLEKHNTPPVSALGEVMRQCRNHYSGDPSHWRNKIWKGIAKSYIGNSPSS